MAKKKLTKKNSRTILPESSDGNSPEITKEDSLDADLDSDTPPRFGTPTMNGVQDHHENSNAEDNEETESAFEKEQREKEQREKQQREREQREREQREKEQKEREQKEKDQREREQKEKEQKEKEQKDKEQKEKEQREREQREREQKENGHTGEAREDQDENGIESEKSANK